MFILFTQAAESAKPEICVAMVAFLEIRGYKKALESYQHDPTTLNLDYFPVGIGGIRALTDVLPQCEALRTLSLKGNDLGFFGAAVLAEALPMTEITALDLGGNNIDHTGLQKLAEALPQTKLTTLNLLGNNIGPEGAEMLLYVLSETSLTKLELGGNKIKDAVIKIINATLQANRRL